LITIIDKNKEEKIVRSYKKFKLPFQVIHSGVGTASSSLLEYFGLNEVKKDIILSIIPEGFEGKILYQLYHEYHIYKPGQGIAFTIPISSSSRYLLDEANKIVKSKEVIKMIQNKNYQLILTIVNEGYSEEIMNGAKKMGAGGGTVIHGRGLGSKEATKFLGISIEPEKDVILILTEKEKKDQIMNEINQKAGLSTGGQGICFSIPVDTVIGLDKDITFEKINEK